MENKKMIDILNKVRDELDGYFEILDLVGSLDRPYSEALEEIQLAHPDQKLKKKEKIAIFIKMIDEKLPNFAKFLNEFDLMIEAIEYRIDITKDKLQQKIDALDEIEEMQQEIQDKKDSLDI